MTLVVVLAACGSEAAVSSQPVDPTAPMASADVPSSVASAETLVTVPPDSVDLPVATTMPAVAPVTGATYPATTVVDVNAPVGAAPTAPVVLDEQDRCTPEPVVDFNDAADHQPMFDESARLEPMLGAVVNYGGQHPDEFGGYGFRWLDSADASAFAMFTDHVDEHRAALSAIVPYPDELYVCQAALSEASARGLQALLFDEFNGRFTSLGTRRGSIEIGLQADQEAAAADLVARYGDAVIVRVGNLPYPLAADEQAAAVCDVDVAGPTEIAGGVTATLSLPDRLPNTGATIDGTVTIVNNSTAAFEFSTGILVGVIVEADTFRAVAVYGGGINSIGLGGLLQPGESQDLQLLISTASCDADLGYTLPPGTYDLVVPVLVDHGINLGDTPVNELIVRTRIEID